MRKTKSNVTQIDRHRASIQFQVLFNGIKSSSKIPADIREILMAQVADVADAVGLNFVGLPAINPTAAERAIGHRTKDAVNLIEPDAVEKPVDILDRLQRNLHDCADIARMIYRATTLADADADRLSCTTDVLTGISVTSRRMAEDIDAIREDVELLYDMLKSDGSKAVVR